MIVGEKYKSSSTDNMLFILQYVFIAYVSAGYVKLSWFLIFNPEKNNCNERLN